MSSLLSLFRDRFLKLLTKPATELRLPLRNAEKRTADATRLAAQNEKWARKCDAMRVAATDRIAEPEKYLGEHREWVLRCEAELEQLRNRAKESAL